MTHWIIHIFDLLKKRKVAGLTLLLLLTLLLAALLMRQSFKEDISDFLPLEGRSQQAMEVYKDMAGTDRIFAVVQMAGQNQPDADLMTEAVDMLESALEETDTAHWLTDVTSQVDMEQIEELTDFAYSNIPYFLSDSAAGRQHAAGPPEYLHAFGDKTAGCPPTVGLRNLQRIYLLT